MTEAPAAVAETHVSVVVFIGDRAYKVKKPVSMGFLDFSTRERREAACRREVELNRRLAPDVYLGIATVHGPDGTPCEHLVVMRRMPAERRLGTLVLQGRPVDDQLRRVARDVASFHARAGRGPEIDREASRDALRRKWHANFAEVRRTSAAALDDGDVRRLEEMVERYLDGRTRLFDTRLAQGHAVDGHGDLLTDDIFCLDDGPRILDCIEFDDALRYGDVLSDVAFLAMDLERLGAAGLAASFLGWYREFSGDTHPQSLASHYVAFRAHIRTKVACLRYAQAREEEKADEARVLLAIALRHLDRARERLVLVGGLPGTGKSTVAAGMSARRGWTVLRSDEVRKDLAGIGHLERVAGAFGSGLYSRTHTDATYAELVARARVALGMGESVVLDASWSDARHREGAARVAQETASDLVPLRCVAPADVASARLDSRARDASDATAAVAAAMARSADAWDDAVVVETSGSLEAALAAALGASGP